MYERTGTDWRLDDLAAELGKTLKGDELVEAVGFGMALDRQTREGRKPPDQRKLQAEERARVEAAERTRDALQAESEAEIEQARADKDRVEAELMRDVGRRTAPAATQGRSRTEKYQILRSSGMSPEEARMTLGMETELEPTPGADLRTPEGEDFTLRGAVAPVDDQVDELTLRGEVVPVDEPEATTADDEPEKRRLDPDELLRIYGG
jgi:hypothetical protein